MGKFEHVLSPFKIGNVQVKNRIELAPACYMLATHDGYVTREMVAYYQNLARGGAGIITIGESPIDFEYASGHEFQLNLNDHKVINGLSVLVENVHRYGAKLSIEMTHCGRYVLNNKQTIGPSNIPAEMEVLKARREGRKVRQVIEMTQDMIDTVIEHYATAAENCLRAGFEMVMIHAAHGHLIPQFLSPMTNKRTDRYGGSLENRARFAIEVLNAIRARVGNKLAIEWRISANELVPDGLTEEDTIEFVKLIEDKIDLLHVSAGLLNESRIIPHMIQPTYLPHCYNVHRAEIMKKALKVPIATVGSIHNMNEAEEIVASGKADIVAMARAILVDPEIVNKARRGQEEDIRPCLRCHTCNKLTAAFYPIRCAVNPILGRELTYVPFPKAEIKKKVVVVGGGPGGMQAALTASQRGHEVVLFEKNNQLGGNLLLAAGLKIKADMRQYLAWLIRQTEKAEGVTIKLNTEATVETVKAENPDAVIVAVGSDPIIPRIPGVDGKNVVWVGEVDAGQAQVGQNVVIAGGGATGAEAALQLAKDGHKVTLIDMLDYNTLTPEYPRGLLFLLEDYKVDMRFSVKLEEITDTGAVVIDSKWQRTEIPADTVILSFGFKPRTAVAEAFQALESANTEVYLVGDCLKPQNIKEAIHGGFNTAVEI
jgi:2,4-dienoyl-CoA reductase-like NADH-dependent reductase (Old Yellow Enzyme family)/thioredoxin reductase